MECRHTIFLIFVKIRIGAFINRLKGKKEKGQSNFKAGVNLVTHYVVFKITFSSDNS